MNYQKFMDHNPFKYGSMTNSKGQVVDFYEHPLAGDTYPIVAVCHDLKLVRITDFYELDDMMADHGEYEPIFADGELLYGHETRLTDES